MPDSHIPGEQKIKILFTKCHLNSFSKNEKWGENMLRIDSDETGKSNENGSLYVLGFFSGFTFILLDFL